MPKQDLDIIEIGVGPSDEGANHTDAAKHGKKKRKSGSGRLAGSYSFGRCTMADLQKLFASPDAKVIVSRKWAETCGLELEKCTAAGKMFDSVEGTTPNTKPTVRVQEL